MRIEVGSALADAATAGLLDGTVPDGGSFLPSGWRDRGAFEQRIRYLDGRFTRSDRERISRWMHPAGRRARAGLGEFVENEGLIVTTGQQAGLFTGPMLTIAKALTAVHVADDLERRLGRPVLPVFWIAADDHDVDEVASTRLFDETGSFLVSVAPVREDGRPVGRIPVSDTSWEHALDGLVQSVGAAPFGDDVLKWVRGAYSPAATLSRAFSALLARLLADTPICLLDASEPALHRSSGSIYESEILLEEETGDTLSRTADALARRGVEPPVPILPGASNLFVENGPRRERLYRRDGTWVTAESGRRFDRDSILRIVRERPEIVSPNVLLRPVVEAAILPTVVQVAGPSEIGYLAQIGSLFEAHRVERPLIVPRCTVTATEPWMDDELADLGIDRSDLGQPPEVLWEEISRRRLAPRLDARSRDLRERIVDAYASFLGGEPRAPDDALRRVLALRNRSLSLAHDAERAVLRSIKRSAASDRRRFEAVRSVLRPGGGPQDRVINILPFVARHGPGFIARMAEAITRSMERERTTPPTRSEVPGER